MTQTHLSLFSGIGGLADASGRSTESGLGRVADGLPSGVDAIGLDGWWAIEPDIPRVAGSVPNRVERLKCLGNAVVPAQFYPIFATIAEIERTPHGQDG